jgi:hypothetical protein
MARYAILVCVPIVALACGGGDGGPIPSTTTSTQQSAGSGGRDTPPAGRDPAAGGKDAPPASQDPPAPSQDPGAPTGAPVCVTCDAKYVCKGTLNGQPVTDSSIELKTSNGTCILDGQQAVTVIACNGKVVAGGQAVGTWQPDGAGFSFSGNGITLDCQPAPVAQPGGK